MSARVSPDSPPATEEPRAREALEALADPVLMALPERWAASAPPPLPPLEVRVRPPRVHVEPETWGAGHLHIEEREIPFELTQDLRQLAPQALLRDLYRPVRESIWHERWPLVDDLDPGGHQAMAAARAQRTREPLPQLTPTIRVFADEQHRRRAWLAEPWQPSLADDQPRPRLDTPTWPTLPD